MHHLFRDPCSDPPGWDDAGPIMLRKGCDIIKANLTIDEFWTGEDEVPLPSVRLETGEEVSIFDYDGWRTAK